MGIGFYELLILSLGFWLVIMPAGIVGGVRLASARRVEEGRPDGVVEAIRHARITSILATGSFAVVIFLGVPMTSAAESRRDLASIPVLASLVALGVLALGELWARRREGPRRTTTLNARTPVDVAAGGWLRAWLLAAAALIVVAVGCPILADRGAGRVFDRPRWEPDTLGGTPGWDVTGPQLGGLLLVGLAWAAVVRFAALRPTVADADVALDNALRRASAARATRAALAGTLLTLGGDLAVAGVSGLVSTPGNSDALGVGASLLGVLLICCGLWTPLIPSARLPKVAPSPSMSLPSP